MNWNHLYYDYPGNRFGLESFLEKGRQLYGGNEVKGIWPTWPTLGVDQRNQFDLYSDLPGETTKIRELSSIMKQRYGTRLFVSYNPWAESTRSKGHLAGLERLLRDTDADGMVLDTKGDTSRELQVTVDKL